MELGIIHISRSTTSKLYIADILHVMISRHYATDFEKLSPDISTSRLNTSQIKLSLAPGL